MTVDDIVKGAKDLGKKVKDRTLYICDSVVDDLSSAYKKGEEKFEDVYSRNAEKLEGFLDNKGDYFKDVIDKALESDYVQAIEGAIKDNVSNGKQAVSDAVKNVYDSYQAKMDEKSKESPRAVGFGDGLVQAMTGIEVNRRPMSKIYKHHKTYGNIAGWGLSGALFLKGRLFLAATPVINRGVTYFYDRVKEDMPYKKD